MIGKTVTSHLVDPSGAPVRSAPNNDDLRERVSLLRELLNRKENVLPNSLTGLAQSFGGLQQDNISSLLPLYTSNQYAPLTSNYTLLTYLYKSHGILQTAIDEPVLDAFRDGLEITSDELGEGARRAIEAGEYEEEEPLGEGTVGSSGLGELEDFAEEIGAWDSLQYMLTWGGLYGGAGLVINAGQDPTKPLDENDIKRGNLEFYDADRWEFSGAWRGAKSFLFYGERLDATRVLTYGGKRAPKYIRSQLAGWGMSEMERMSEDFNLWLRGRNVLYEILEEAKVDKYRINNYASTLMLPDGEQTIRKRIMATNSIKSFHNALILDKEDDYEVISNSFTGLAEVMRENRIGIACATRMPFSKLFGTTAGGGSLANSGQDDLENYNALVTSRVRRPARPIIRKMLRLMMVACFGREYDIRFDFRPLRQMTAKEEEELKDLKQQRYERLYDKRMIDSKEFGDILAREKLLPIKTKAQMGLLPAHVEVPTAEQMFADKPQHGMNGGGDDGRQGA